MYDLKWKKDFAMYVDTFDNFIFEGNINDLQPSETAEGGWEYLPVKDVIAKEYGGEYCVMFYDHTKLGGKTLPDAPAKGRPGVAPPADPPKEPDEGWFNSFTVAEPSRTVYSAGRAVPAPGIKLFLEYYKREYLQDIEESNTQSLRADITKDMRRIFDAMSEFSERAGQPEFAGAKPFMFVLPDVSRYMTFPGEPDDKESAQLMILFNAMQIVDTPCKLLLFVDKLNDLPAWFESESNNSAVKKIYLPTPERDIREDFCRCELLSSMQDAGVDERALAGKLGKFAAYTEGFSLRRLLQLKDFILNDEKHRTPREPSLLRLSNIDKAVLKFTSGMNTDPWRDPALARNIDGLPRRISEDIMGQSPAAFAITAALKAAAAGVGSSKKNDRRPKAVFVFAGPTGVGKTEMTKIVAESIFGNSDSMIRFDMSEFGQEHADARLFGAPPGYVGYEAGGELTRAVKQRPFSIILFDEIEKASSKIWDKFLQILGDGRLTDSKGETVSFTQSIIAFTTNLGIKGAGEVRGPFLTAPSADIAAKLAALPADDVKGRRRLADEQFALDVERMGSTTLTAKLMEMPIFTAHHDELGYNTVVDAFNAFVNVCVRKRIENYFNAIGRREVLGRIGDDNILVFNFISAYHATMIAEKTLDRYIEKISEDRNGELEITCTSAVRAFIRSGAGDPEVIDFGGRGIVNYVEKTFGAIMGDFLFAHPDAKRALIDVRDDKLTVVAQ